MKKLLFYTINKEYINFLRKYESHVSYNKDEKKHSRPYLGIVLKIENFEYFAPLYSFKKQYKKYKNNPSFFFVYGRKRNPLAIIKFSSMIPIPQNNNNNVVNLLEYELQESIKYKEE